MACEHSLLGSREPWNYALANSKYGGIELKQAAAVADVAGRARLTI
jgi:hypothetical protein